MSVSFIEKKLKNLDSASKAAVIAEYADDMKALDIETLDIRHKSSVTDYFVICTGTSDTHVRSVAERVSERMREGGLKAIRQSETKGDGWVLFDFGDVIFHVMLEEKRQFYDLESLWANMQVDPNLVVEDKP